jgi:hypothetical protein
VYVGVYRCVQVCAWIHKHFYNGGKAHWATIKSVLAALLCRFLFSEGQAQWENQANPLVFSEYQWKLKSYASSVKHLEFYLKINNQKCVNIINLYNSSSHSNFLVSLKQLKIPHYKIRPCIPKIKQEPNTKMLLNESVKI